MISKDEASGVSCPGIPEGLTALRNRGHSKDITFPLEAENARLKARVQELEEDLQTVFINVTETFEAVATALKDQAVLRGKDMAAFMEPAKEAAKEGDSIRVLAYARQGITKLKKALHDSPIPTLKAIADPEKPRLVALPKTQLRALEIKERLEECGLKTFSSRDARQYISGVEGEEPSRRDTIRALKQTVKLLPQYALEVVGGISRLICKDTRFPKERVVLDEAGKSVRNPEGDQERSQWQRKGWRVAIPWIDPQGLRSDLGRS